MTDTKSFHTIYTHTIINHSFSCVLRNVHGNYTRKMGDGRFMCGSLLSTFQQSELDLTTTVSTIELLLERDNL